MTVAEGELKLFGNTHVLCTNFGVHVVKNGRISPEIVQTDPEEIWADSALHVARAEQDMDPEVFARPSPDRIILNTNKRVNRPIRFFSNDEHTQDAINDWDPMNLSDIFSDNVTD